MVGIVDCVLCFFLSGYHVVRFGARVSQNGFVASWTDGRHVFFDCGMPCAEKIREGKRVTQDPDARKVSYKFESARILIFISIGAKCSNAPV